MDSGQIYQKLSYGTAPDFVATLLLLLAVTDSFGAVAACHEEQLAAVNSTDRYNRLGKSPSVDIFFN